MSGDHLQLRLGQYVYLPVLCGILLISWQIYAPGLHGGFLFDDYANLPSLGATGPIDHWSAFWRYITSGHADPTGRPIAMLSFLLDARDWPASPFSFKRTNLLLHLLNGALLALLLRQLGRSSVRNAQAPSASDYLRIDLAALLGAALWLVHPLFVSTTLYIVQREAMLPATFTLIGLLLWLRARYAMLQGRTATGLIGIIAGLGVCTLLATLSKANGILLPSLALVIEYVLLRVAGQQAPHSALPAEPGSSSSNARQHNEGFYRKAMLLFAWLPTAVIAAYLAQQGWNGFTHGISQVRPWTLAQRLLTEPRVLVDYLRLLWLPRAFTPGLFNDQIRASTTLWSPASTLPAVCTIAALIIGGWLIRRRRPALALAILFYFVGQALESSTVALELYFEHRNYLPAMLMFWPLALWLCDAHPAVFGHITYTSDQHQPGTKTNRPALAKAALAVLILLGCSVMTHARAKLWGDLQDQALLWARLNPSSPRAQAYATEIDMATGNPARAIARLRPLLARHPDQVQLALNLFGAECQMGEVDPATLSASRIALSTARDPGTLLTHWFERVMDQVAKPPCPQLSYGTIDSLLDAGLTNPHFTSTAGREQDLYYLKGRLALKQGDAERALNDFNHALDLQVRIAAALGQAALLGSAGYPRLGLAHLDHYEAESNREAQPDFGMPRVHAWVLQRQQYWPREVAHLRATLQQDATQQAANHP
ncbi:tetratricopeptide repeat protein [Dyella sp.]|uniref:tetratricopeptide repeat protein n=1 Tax=Dyella sp. TaxID=1869338 RepID=UPI002D7F890F|nr:tetratricopeptide repeat protein [Dyella sp.]